MSSKTIYTSPLCSCIICHKECSSKGINSHHLAMHIENKTRKYIGSVCIFCKEFHKQSNHKTYCKDNPNRKVRIASNQYTKARSNGYEYIISEETRLKYRNANLNRKHTEETKNKIRVSMARVSRERPESYAGNYNRGYVKMIVSSNGFKVLGNWELFFVETCLENNIEILQPNLGFSYVWNGERTYYPDFYLPEYDLWIEIKGHQTDRDLAKWQSLRDIHKKNLSVLGGGIDQIRTDIFSIMSRKS